MPPMRCRSTYRTCTPNGCSVFSEEGFEQAYWTDVIGSLRDDAGAAE